jgi:hypothetical protein
MPDINREGWVMALTNELRPYFEAHGYRLPDKMRGACGFPSTRALRSSRQSLGECWPADASEDGTTEFFVNPVLDDPLEVAAMVFHELVHAAVGTACGHKGPFKRAMRLLGLEGKPTSAYPGEELTARLNALTQDLGPYPHATLSGERPRKKQDTRLIKCWCPGCTYTVRITRRWIVVGLPLCPQCTTAMVTEWGLSQEREEEERPEEASPWSRLGD